VNVDVNVSFLTFSEPCIVICIYVRMTHEMHTFSHSFIPIKLSSTYFEKIIVHH